MMTIGSIMGAEKSTQAGRSGMNQTDAVSKNIQAQIASAQKKLQELSSNEELTLEEKMKKRKEIQQEIADLNQQLRQHQMEQRREQQEKGRAVSDLLGVRQGAGAAGAGSGGSGLSQASMQAMLSADTSMKQARVQGSVSARMKNRAGVLKAEIKMDKGKGDVKAKEAELADVEQKAEKAAASQAGSLASANQAAKEAANAQQDNGSENAETKKKDKKAKEAQSKTRKKDKKAKEAEVKSKKEDKKAKEALLKAENKDSTAAAAGVRAESGNSSGKMHPDVILDTDTAGVRAETRNSTAAVQTAGSQSIAYTSIDLRL